MAVNIYAVFFILSVVGSALGSRVRRWPDGASSSSSSYSSSGSFGGSGYSGSNSGQMPYGGGYDGGYGAPMNNGFYFPNQGYQPDYSLLFQQFLASMAAQQAQGQFYPQFGFPQNNNINPDASAAASVGFGPQGGYAQTNLGGGPDQGLGLRIGGGDFIPPSNNAGGSYSTFSSSSSGTSDVNGKRTSFKQASVGVNDNGKVYFKSVSDP